MPKLHRATKYAKWILEQAFPDVQVTTWIPAIDDRRYPIINLRSLGGYRSFKYPTLLAESVVEITCLSDVDLMQAEDLYIEALEALYDAYKNQVITPYGHLSSCKETMGLTQFSSEFQETWRAQGLVELGIRSKRN